METKEQALGEIQEHLYRLSEIFDEVWSTQIVGLSEEDRPHEQVMKGVKNHNARISLSKNRSLFYDQAAAIKNRIYMLCKELGYAHARSSTGEELIVCSFPRNGIPETGRQIRLGAEHYIVFKPFHRGTGTPPPTEENKERLQKALECFLGWVAACPKDPKVLATDMLKVYWGDAQ